MSELKNFIMTWPELNVSVECEPLEDNRQIYAWWLSQMPIKTIQTHAAVTGNLMYNLNVWMPERLPTFPKDEVKYTSMTEAPIGYGNMGFNERQAFGAGQVGVFDLVYGKCTEDMVVAYVYRVLPEYIETIKEVGQKVWESFYRTKEIITVELTVKE